MQIAKFDLQTFSKLIKSTSIIKFRSWYLVILQPSLSFPASLLRKLKISIDSSQPSNFTSWSCFWFNFNLWMINLGRYLECSLILISDSNTSQLKFAWKSFNEARGPPLAHILYEAMLWIISTAIDHKLRQPSVCVEGVETREDIFV